MDISHIKKRFAKELTAVRGAASPKARKYSPALKSAIIELNESGVSLQEIRRALGLSGGAFSSWRHPPPLRRQKAAFTPVAVASQIPVTAPVAGVIVIEAPSGIVIRVHH